MSWIVDAAPLSSCVGQIPESELVARKLGKVEYGFFAAPDYLTQHGTPDHPTMFKASEFIGFTGPPVEVVCGIESCLLPYRPRYIANTNMAIRDMAVATLGVALLPCFQAAPFVAEGQLTNVLPGWSRPPVDVHAVMPSSRLVSPTTRSFIDLARKDELFKSAG